MNPTDTQKLQSALAVLTNVHAELANLVGRGLRASKAWVTESENAKNPKVKAGTKQWAAALAQLMKQAKVVDKDLKQLGKEAGDAKLLGKYATAKEFRDKVVAKRLASSKAFDEAASRLVLAVLADGGDNLYPGMNNVDVKVSMNSMKNFNKRYNDLRISLGKV